MALGRLPSWLPLVIEKPPVEDDDFVAMRRLFPAKEWEAPPRWGVVHGKLNLNGSWNHFFGPDRKAGKRFLSLEQLDGEPTVFGG
jgi:hypothetical protein